jgi:hypothetical protein|tara:strand:+ start:23 stop:247 length:225 start_codon:yes stop_codon:yes gene_type:complete
MTLGFCINEKYSPQKMGMSNLFLLSDFGEENCENSRRMNRNCLMTIALKLIKFIEIFFTKDIDRLEVKKTRLIF